MGWGTPCDPTSSRWGGSWGNDPTSMGLVKGDPAHEPPLWGWAWVTKESGHYYMWGGFLLLPPFPTPPPSSSSPSPSPSPFFLFSYKLKSLQLTLSQTTSNVIRGIHDLMIILKGTSISERLNENISHCYSITPQLLDTFTLPPPSWYYFVNLDEKCIMWTMRDVKCSLYLLLARCVKIQLYI
jgi:hypothetical protein